MIKIDDVTLNINRVMMCCKGVVTLGDWFKIETPSCYYNTIMKIATYRVLHCFVLVVAKTACLSIIKI